MKTTLVIKILLDIVLCAVMAALYFPNRTGIAFHELVGLGALAAVGAHLALNGSWVRSLLGGKLTSKEPKVVATVAVNTALMPVMLLTCATGVLCSRTLLPNINGTLWRLDSLHRLCAWALAALLIAHVLLHVRYIARVLGKLRQNLRQRNVRRTLTGFASGIALCCVLYVQVASAIDSATATRDEAAYVQPVGQTPSISTQADSSIEHESIASAQSAEPVTLEEYLGKLVCTACGRRCSLLSPRCRRGEQQVAQAKQQYEQQYPISET